MFISRLTFAYHYFPSSVFLVLSLGYVFALFRENARLWLLRAAGFAHISTRSDLGGNERTSGGQRPTPQTTFALPHPTPA